MTEEGVQLPPVGDAANPTDTGRPSATPDQGPTVTIGPDGCESDRYLFYCTGFGPMERGGKCLSLGKYVDSKLTQEGRAKALQETKKRLYAALRKSGKGRVSPSCRASIIVHGKVMDAIVDTGATRTMLNKEAWERLQCQDCCAYQPSDVKLRGASGSNLRVHGEFVMNFVLQNTQYHTDCVVGDLGDIDCLLGLDFLMAVGARIDLGDMTISISRTIARLRDHPGPEIYPVYAEKTTTCDGYAVTALECLIGATTSLSGEPLLFESMLEEDTAVTLPDVLVTPSHGAVGLRVDNTHPGATTIPRGTPIGFVSKVAPVIQSGDRLLYASDHVSGMPVDLSKKHADLPSEPDRQIWKVFDLTARDEATRQVNDEGIGLVKQACLPLGKRGAIAVEVDGATFKGNSSPTVAGGHQLLGEDSSGGDRVLTCVDTDGHELTETERNLQLEHDDVGRQGTKLSGNPLSPRASGREGRHLRVVPPESVSLEPGQGPSENLGHDAETALASEEQSASGTRGVPLTLPEHLACMMPTDGELDPVQEQKVTKLLLDYQDVFIGPDKKVGFTDLVTHKIDTLDAAPRRSCWFRKSFQERDAIAEEVNKLLETHKIEPSKSPWASSVVLVRKKDGTLRFCIDYRGVNAVTKKDAYPLPRIDACLDALTGSRWFSTLDLASGYWQVAMEEGSREKTAFYTHLGLFQWKVMPFGLCNAPATFERLMETVLGDIQWTKVLVYLDDIVAFGKTFEEAYKNLEDVFLRMRRAHLTLKGSKCALFRHKVEYLGHIVSRDGVQPTDSKIEAIRHWAVPSNLTDVRAFLGITSYYRTYIQNYSEIAEPLTRLTKKDTPFAWGSQQKNAFDILRKALCSQPILAYPKRGGRFWLDTDASDYAIGAVLSQEQDGELRVIAYASKTLGPTQKHYCATKKELLAVVYFTRHFRHYLMGDIFNIRTDHASLQWLMSFRQTDNMQQRWLQCMQNYTFDLHHRDGKKHLNADSMSRMVRQQHHCGRKECVDCNQAFRKGVAKPAKPARKPPSDPDEDDWSGAEDLEWPRVDFVGCRFIPRTKEEMALDHRRVGLGENGSPDGDSGKTRTSKGRGYRSTIYYALRSAKKSSRADSDPNWRDKSDGDGRRRPTRRQAAEKALRRLKRWAEADSGNETDTDKNSFRSLKNRQRRLRSRKTRTADRTQTRGRRSRRNPITDPSPDTDPAPPASDSGMDTMDPESGGERRSQEKDEETQEQRCPEGESEEVGVKLPEGSTIEVELREWARGLTKKDWEERQKEDPVLARIRSFIEKYGDDPPPPKILESEGKELRQYCRHWGALVLRDGVLRRRFRPDIGSTRESELAVVPMQMRLELFMRIHASDAAHLGYDRVHKLLIDRVWWVGMSTDVLDWLPAC